MSLALRDYQEHALDAIEGALGRGVARQLLALPTGAGKTIVFSHLIQRRGGAGALILAHRDELLGQAEEKLRLVAPELGMNIGRVQAGRDDTGAPIVVASVQTLARRARLARLPRSWQTVIVDEAHHATADSYRRVLDHVEAELVLGVTATPERSDKGKLSDVFDELVYARSILELIEAGYLSDLRGVRVTLEDLDLAGVKVSRGDYQADDLGRAMRAAGAPAHTAASLIEHAGDRRSLVFCPTVELAHETAAAIDAAGIPAAAIDGTTPIEQRRGVLADLGSGRLRAVANVGVLTEGFDEPSVSCIAIAAPTRSRVRYQQMVGRGTRIHPGKDDCLVLDLAGVTEELRLQSLPALFGFEGELREGETVAEAAERERAAAAEQEALDVEKRKRKARKAELFGRKAMHWLEVGERWVLPAGGPDLLVLDPVREGAYRVLLLREDRARILARDLDLGYAQGAAEETVRQRDATALARPNASWRRSKPSPGQLRYLAYLGLPDDPKTKGEASDLINAEIARRRLVRLDRALAEREAELGKNPNREAVAA